MEEAGNKAPKSHKSLKLSLAVVAVLLIWLLSMSIVVTKEDEYTLVLAFGKVDREISKAGLSFKLPFIETTMTLPRKVMLYDLNTSDVITMDKKTMVADSYVLWEITDPQIFNQTLNSQISSAESRINTTVYNSMKNVISSMSQADVISSRDGDLSERIMDNIGDYMERYGIRLLCVETKHLDLPSDNKAAVYERMISERNNIAAAYTAEGEAEAKKIRTKTDNQIAVNISEAEAEAERIIAEGEAEYMKILSEAYASKERSDFYTFVRALDAVKVAMTGENKTVILSSDSPIAQIFNTIQ